MPITRPGCRVLGGGCRPADPFLGIAGNKAAQEQGLHSNVVRPRNQTGGSHGDPDVGSINLPKDPFLVSRDSGNRVRSYGSG